MEAEKKRKRVEDGGGRRRKEREPKLEAEANAKAAAVATPTDEEVDEFFAILKRMHVAVKYFEKSHAAGRKLTGRWATALEAEVLAGVKVPEESTCGVRKNGTLDLNALPEAESNSF